MTMSGLRVLEVSSEAICLVCMKFALKSLSYKMHNCLMVTAAQSIITSQADDSLLGIFLRSADQEIFDIQWTLNSYNEIFGIFS